MNKKLLTADQLKRLAQDLDNRIDSAVLKEIKIQHKKIFKGGGF